MKITELNFNQFDELTSQFTDKQIAERFESNKNYVGYCRRKLGVKSFGEKHNIVVGVKGISNVSNRKHHFNERFFQVIDSEVKAYALGLMMTDGHITKSLHRARLHLTEDDGYVLEAIAKAADFTGELLIDRPKEGSRQVKNMKILNFNSTLLVKDLLALGLTTSKATTLALPKIDPSLENHLIRGIIDGDGGFMKRDEILCISGRKELLEDIIDCFARHGFSKVGRLRTDKTIYRLRMPRYAIPAIDWVYGTNPTIFLRRKYNRYQTRKSFESSWTTKY